MEMVPINFPEFLFSTVLFSDLGSSMITFSGKIPPQVSFKESVIPAAARLLVVLSAHKGASRKLILQTLVSSLQQSVLELQKGAAIIDENSQSHLNSDAASLERVKEQSLRARHTARIARLVALVAKASRPTKDSRGSEAPSLVAETLAYLVKAEIQSTLTQAMAFLPLSHAATEATSDALEALCEPLELFTRPKLVAFLRAHEAAQQATVAADAINQAAAQMTDGANAGLTGSSGVATSDSDSTSQLASLSASESASASHAASGSSTSSLADLAVSARAAANSAIEEMWAARRELADPIEGGSTLSGSVSLGSSASDVFGSVSDPLASSSVAGGNASGQGSDEPLWLELNVDEEDVRRIVNGEDEDEDEEEEDEEDEEEEEEEEDLDITEEPEEVVDKEEEHV
jgi:hypothetical protein